jgi:succinyl-CoA synthetase beta subunit
MKIHEYQGKGILARYGVPTPRGEVAFEPAAAAEIARRLGTPVVAVKSQIQAGGRGKGRFKRNGGDGDRGVRLARSPEEAEKFARDMLGATLVTHQTGPDGQIVGRVLIEEGLQMARELYLGLLLDRAAGKLVLMASAAGGMDIEAVAARTPEKIVRAHIEPGVGLMPRSIADRQIRQARNRAARGVRRHRRVARRNQSAGRHRGRRPDRARREDEFRRQRVIPSHRHP